MPEKDLARQIPNAVRYIATNTDEQFWLKSLTIKHSFRMSKDVFVLLLCLDQDDFL